MPVDHKEKTFKTAIEHHLITSSGYVKAEQAHFDQQRAIDPTQFMPFLKDTQTKTLEKLEKLLGNQTETTVLDELCKAMDSRGSLDVLRHGFKCFGDAIKVAYFRPRHSVNPAEQQVYYPNEIEEFAKVFFKPKQSQTPNDHAMMHKILNGPVERFEALGEDEQELYLKQLIAFRQLYSFMSQIIPFQDADLEKLYVFVRLLIPRLPKERTAGVVLDDEVNLKYCRLQKTSDGSISLQAGDRGSVSAPTAVGTGVDRHQQVELSRLIDKINERFGTDFKPVDQLFFDQIKEEAVSDTAIQQAAMVNSLENFGFVFDKALEGKFIDRMDQNQEIFARYMNDKDFQKAVAEWMRKEVYDQVRAESAREVERQAAT